MVILSIGKIELPKQYFLIIIMSIYEKGINDKHEKGNETMGDTVQILIAMVIYMAVVVILGITFCKTSKCEFRCVFSRRKKPWPLGDCNERRSFGHVRLVAHGGCRGLLIGAGSPMRPGRQLVWL